jgi:hypothetical protein
MQQCLLPCHAIVVIFLPRLWLPGLQLHNVN